MMVLEACPECGALGWVYPCSECGAVPSDEPCRCGHPESAHTDMGCGAPTDYASGWAIDSPCTCGAYRVEDLTAGDYRRVRDLCDRYADSDIGFVDAAVLAVVERLDEPKLATLDRRHFSVLRPRHREALLLLPG